MTNPLVARLRAALALLPVSEVTCWTWTEMRIELEAGDFPISGIVALGEALPGAVLTIEYDYGGPCDTGHHQCGGGEAELAIVATWPDGAPAWANEADLTAT